MIVSPKLNTPRPGPPLAPELRVEIQRSVKHADVSRRYFRLRAARLRQISILFVSASTLASITSVAAAIRGQVLLAVVVLAISVVGISVPGLLRLMERRSQHLVAHARALDAGAAWARLLVDGCSSTNLADARLATRKLAAVAPQTRDIVLWAVAEDSFEHALP